MKNPDFHWDASEIFDSELKYRIENQNDFYKEKKSKDQIENDLYDDDVYFSIIREDFIEDLTIELDKYKQMAFNCKKFWI